MADQNAPAAAPAPAPAQQAAPAQPAAQVPPALAAMLPQQPAPAQGQQAAAQPAPAQGAPAQQPAAAAQPAVPPALAAILQQSAPAQGQQPAAHAAQQAPAAQPPAQPPKRSTEEELAALRAELRARDIRALVLATATEAGAINAEQVHALVGADLDVADDGRVIVRNDPRADARQHVARFLAGNLHLLRPVVAGGGAGSPSTVQAPGAAQQLSPHTREGGTQVVHGLLGRLFPAPPPASAPAPGGVAAPR